MSRPRAGACARAWAATARRCCSCTGSRRRTRCGTRWRRGSRPRTPSSRPTCRATATRSGPRRPRTTRRTPSARWRADLVAAMAALGHERFAVAGHDRGGRVAYRMALDRPEVVTRLAVLDIVPTGEIWRRADDTFAHGLLALGVPRAGRPAARADDPRRTPPPSGSRSSGWGSRRATSATRTRSSRPTATQLDDPATVEAICEDYRAGATIDRALDDEDRGAAHDRVPGPRAVGRRRRAAALLRGPARAVAAARARRHGPGGRGRLALPRRGRARRGRGRPRRRSSPPARRARRRAARPASRR